VSTSQQDEAQVMEATAHAMRKEAKKRWVPRATQVPTTPQWWSARCTQKPQMEQ
jgi:hypothetical protein